VAERQITELELLTRVLDARLRGVHVAIPGRIHTFNRSTLVADVIPQVWPDGDEIAVLPAVPVVFPYAASRGLIFDLDPGDPGLCIFAEADLSQWRQQGEPGSPADVARHHIQNAVFLPGLVPRGEEGELPDGATVLFGGDVRVGAPDATEKAVLGDKLDTAFSVYDGAFGTWTVAHKTWVTAVAAAAGVAPAGVTMNAATDVLRTAATQLQADITAALSAIVKVK
jgi:hypothetical protein